jgi:homoserine kinase
MTPTTPPAALRACGVRVPCSTSNLGAGFDCVGLAFDQYLDAGYDPGSGAGTPLQVRRAGTLDALDIDVERDLLIIAFRAELLRRGIERTGGVLLVTSSIPVGRGLGSSAAAVVGGIALATEACGGTLDRDAALAAAVKLEGHPDNAAPALFGGLVSIVYNEHVPRAMRLPLNDRIGFAFAAPDMEVSTQRARAALPQHVPHSAATRNLGRLAALLYGLAHGDAAAVGAGFTDELHVPYRLPLITGARAAMDAARRAGAWGVTLSGSGSGLIAACAAGTEARVVDAMVDAFAAAGAGGNGFIARADPHGVQPRSFSTLRNTLRA